MRAPLLPIFILVATSFVAGADGSLSSSFEIGADLTPNNRIDELVFGRLQEEGHQSANLCSDSVFVRRVYLDVIGTLPTATETRRFLSDTAPDKRDRLVDELLQRDEFVDYWTMKWCDLLRVKAEFPINLWPNAVQAYQRWIRTSIGQNMPYDQFVRAMLTASGSNFRVPPVNFYRALQSTDADAIAEAVALTFMGTRTKDWPSDRRAGMAAFFARVGYKATAEWKEEIVYFHAFPEQDDFDPRNAMLPDGRQVRLGPNDDPREVFADWLIRDNNPWFTGNIVNRVWYWLFGRGIVHEPDDIRRDNPPSNPQLLRYLQQELVGAQYDLKHIYQLILKSKTYQLSSIRANKDAEASALFAHYPLRRLDAEVLIDALCQISDTTESYYSPVPEPFTFVPDQQRSIALADGSITSSFLEMFGRPPRDTGYESERNNRSTAAQRMHMLNSSHIRQKIEKAHKLITQKVAAGKTNEIAEEIYLTVLSRFPTEDELKTVNSYAKQGGVNQQQALLDMTWALINSPEFLYRH